jgi:hypothetical protein
MQRVEHARAAKRPTLHDAMRSPGQISVSDDERDSGSFITESPGDDGRQGVEDGDGETREQKLARNRQNLLASKNSLFKSTPSIPGAQHIRRKLKKSKGKDREDMEKDKDREGGGVKEKKQQQQQQKKKRLSSSSVSSSPPSALPANFDKVNATLFGMLDWVPNDHQQHRQQPSPRGNNKERKKEKKEKKKEKKDRSGAEGTARKRSIDKKESKKEKKEKKEKKRTPRGALSDSRKASSAESGITNHHPTLASRLSRSVGPVEFESATATATAPQQTAPAPPSPREATTKSARFADNAADGVILMPAPAPVAGRKCAFLL